MLETIDDLRQQITRQGQRIAELEAERGRWMQLVRDCVQGMASITADHDAAELVQQALNVGYLNGRDVVIKHV